MAQTTGVDERGQPATAERETNTYAADEHAMIMTGEVLQLPSGRMRRPAPASVAELRDLIEWAWTQRPPNAPHKLLQPRGGVPQVWLLGPDALERLGWMIDLPDGWDEMSLPERREALAAAVQEHLEGGVLDEFLTEGWELRGKDPHPGPWVRLRRGASMVDLILEPFAWVAERTDKVGILGLEPEPADDLDTSEIDAQGLSLPPDATPETDPDTSLPDDDNAAAAELGRRLAACIQHLGVLPAQSSGRTGAAVADAIWNGRKRRGKGLVIDAAGPFPDMVGGPAEHEDLEPPVSWTRPPAALDVLDEFDQATHLVELDQRRAYLGSSGIELGYGTPQHVPGEKAVTAIAGAWTAGKREPQTLCRVNLPALAELGVPEWLPAPHPLMQHDRRGQAWVTSRSIRGLCDPIADGGAGLDLDDLEIEQAWLWPSQARVLDAWTKTLREAAVFFHDSHDVAMEQMVKACYAMYIGRMHNPALWTGKTVAHHHQPVWRAMIMADTRWRNRAHAMAIYRRWGLKPLQTTTDSWVYALRPVTDEDNPEAEAAVPDVADHTGRNGKLKVEASVELVEEIYVPLVNALAAAETPRQIGKALTAAFVRKGSWT